MISSFSPPNCLQQIDDSRLGRNVIPGDEVGMRILEALGIHHDSTPHDIERLHDLGVRESPLNPLAE